MKRFTGTAGFLLLTWAVVTSCGNSSTTSAANTDSMQKNETQNTAAKAGITTADWGETDGKKVALYTLTNNNGRAGTNHQLRRYYYILDGTG
jgi:aldose 1-epimerase